MKQKIFKGLLVALVLFATIVIALLSYVKFVLPNVGPPPELSIEANPTKIERGKYLAHHVAVCMSCHSERDWSKFAGPTVAGTYGGGGELFDIGIGQYTARNITPKHLGNWTDGEIFRAITCGVTKDGNALFPLMPYDNYGKMDKEDIYAIIAYIKSLPAINEGITTPSTSNFPMNFIINTIPQKSDFQSIPDKTNEVDYGKYLTTMASCAHCHTPQDEKGEFIEELEFAGGMEFPIETGGVVRSSNITPDKKTGIGTWSKDVFVQRFKSFADSSFTPTPIAAGDFNTVMPWTEYAGMEIEDLEAIYTYLQSLKPVEHTVSRFDKQPIADIGE
ncbi:MAG: cytochrome c [Chitinophagales bacterium]